MISHTGSLCRQSSGNISLGWLTVISPCQKINTIVWQGTHVGCRASFEPLYVFDLRVAAHGRTPLVRPASYVLSEWANLVQTDRISSTCLRFGLCPPARNLFVHAANPSRAPTTIKDGKAVAALTAHQLATRAAHGPRGHASSHTSWFVWPVHRH